MLTRCQFNENKINAILFKTLQTITKLGVLELSQSHFITHNDDDNDDCDGDVDDPKSWLVRVYKN